MQRAFHYAAVLLALFTAAPAARAQEPALEGGYLSSGSNPDGSEYSGFVEIARHGDSFIVSWIFPKVTDDAILFVPSSVGVGIIHGEMLAVSYYSGRMMGIVLYRIEESGNRLTGRWVAAGNDGTTYTETLTRLTIPLPGPSRVVPHEEQPATPKKRLRPSGGWVL
jgi:hypothetical protein